MGRSRLSFSKSERLKGKKIIEELFQRGSSFYLKNFLVRYLPMDSSGPDQILISVPKKKFKRAVDRNLVRRRIREAYRLNKQILNASEKSPKLSIGFIYLSSEILTFDNIQAQLIQGLERLGKIKAERT